MTGGGSQGDVDVLNGAGSLGGQLLVGGGGTPSDPRGLYFVDNNNVLISDSHTGSILEVDQSQFTSTVTPEPSSWSLLAMGVAGLPALATRARRRQRSN